jgi:hypothetical protein
LRQMQESTEERGEGGPRAGHSAEIIEVDNIQEIMDSGMMMTRALYIDGKSMAVGRAASVEEIMRDCGDQA